MTVTRDTPYSLDDGWLIVPSVTRLFAQRVGIVESVLVEQKNTLGFINIVLVVANGISINLPFNVEDGSDAPVSLLHELANGGALPKSVANRLADDLGVLFN